MNPKIWLSTPHIGTFEQQFVEEAFATNWIAPLGPNVDGFERDLSEFIRVPHVAVLSSGTAAIHLALIILGVGPRDFVLCQSFTFSGSANPIAYQGATPVFIDSEKQSWNMCPAALEQALAELKQQGKSVKAIIPVHLYGMPARMNEILALAQQYGVPVVEDAAEALGSTYEGKVCGSFGEIGILSFNGNKIITTSGGGALISKNEEWVRKARFLATQARDNAPHYQHSVIGYNYRLSNICAGVGRGQILVLSERVKQRRANYKFYHESLYDLPGIEFLQEPLGSYSNRWLTCIQVNPVKSGGITCEKIRLRLEQENIESRPLWKPMHLQPVFKNSLYFGENVAEHLFNSGLCLPSGSNLSINDIRKVVQTIRSCWLL